MEEIEQTEIEKGVSIKGIIITLAIIILIAVVIFGSLMYLKSNETILETEEEGFSMLWSPDGLQAVIIESREVRELVSYNCTIKGNFDSCEEISRENATGIMFFLHVNPND